MGQGDWWVVVEKRWTSQASQASLQSLGINFKRFRLEALDGGCAGLLFETARLEDSPISDDADDSFRFIRYQFKPDFLDIKQLRPR